jgi:hypothetical protein
MNYLSLLFIALCLLSPGIPLSAAEPTILIDTDFSNQTPGEEVIAEKDQVVPLKFPTSMVVGGNSTSSITIAKEAMGSLKPPFALFQLGGQNEDPDALGHALLNWDLSQEALAEGCFELAATITPLDAEINDGRLRINFGGESARDKRGLMFYFSGTRFSMGGKSFPFTAEETYEIKMRFDLSRREWSGSINGEEVFPTMPFPPQMSAENAPELLITSAYIGGSCVVKQGSRYAISRLTLKKLAE